MAEISRTRYYVSLTIGIVFVLVVGYFFGLRHMRFFLVPTNSMVPTLQPRDYIMTMSDPEYERGDIVVLEDPENEGEYIVKRIVGLPGDTLAIDAGALFLNGKYASEPYIREPMEQTMAPVTLPEGQAWVLGDNRNESDDSLRWGHGVYLSTVVGRVRYIYSPAEHRGPVASYPLTNTAFE